MPFETGEAAEIHSPRRAPSPLPWLTLAAMLVAVGTVGADDNSGVVAPRIAVYPAVALGVLGLSLLVGSHWGRGKLVLIPIGLLFMPLTLGAAAIDLPLQGRTGTVYEYASDASDLEPHYEILAGELTLDLSQLRDLSQNVDVRVTQVTGALVVGVPRGMGVRVVGEMDAGAYENWLKAGRHKAGVNIRVDDATPARRGFGTVTINFRQGMGSVTVMRVEREIQDGAGDIMPYHDVRLPKKGVS